MDGVTGYYGFVMQRYRGRRIAHTLNTQVDSNGTLVDLTDPVITDVADGIFYNSTKLRDVDYTNVLDCVFATLAIEDPESPVTHLNVSVRRSTGGDIVTEKIYHPCDNETDCVPGKVRIPDRHAYYRADNT